MKLLYVLGILSIAILHVNAKTTTEEQRKAVRAMSEGCRSTEGASEQDVDDLIDDKVPESKEGKCLAHCMMKQFSVIKETSEGSGQYQVCKSCMVALTEAAIEDEEERKKTKEVIEVCGPVSNPDRCDFAADVMKCFNEEGAKRGITPGSFK